MASCSHPPSATWAPITLVPSPVLLAGEGDPRIGLLPPNSAAVESDTLVVIIGGDGNPGSDTDPSPTRPLAPLLAAKHPDMWLLGRPCFQLPSTDTLDCGPERWRSERYSEETVTMMSGVLTALAQQQGRSHVRLVGYSGGGTLAVLISDINPLVRDVLTIAAPLDLQAWAMLRKGRGLEASMDPMTRHTHGGFSGLIRYEHWVGARDVVVPPAHALDYSLAFPEEKFTTFPLFDHHCCWHQQTLFH